MGRLVEEYLKKKKELQDKMDYFRLPGNYGYPEMSSEEIEELQIMHDEVLRSLDEAMVAESDAEELQDSYSQQQALEMDRNILHYAKPGMKLPEILNQSKTLTFNVSDKVFEKFGAAMSSRQRMRIPGPDGKIMTGYYTEKSVLGQKENTQLLIESFSQKYPAMRDFFEDFGEDFIKNRNSHNRTDDSDVRMYKITNEDFNTDAAREFKENLYKAEESQRIYAVNISDSSKGRIDSRNVAMKNVADMLGVGHLIPTTFKMNVVRGNQVIEGSFMEEANGSNFSDRNVEGNGLDKLNKESFDNPQVLKQLTDLFVLDFICGNVDRHEGNMILQTDPNNPSKVIGIQGIDNDLSFGNGSSWNWTEAKNDIRSLSFISESMLNKLKSIKSGTISKCLDGMELDNKAAVEMQVRILKVLEKVDKKSIQVLSDKDFENKTLKDFSESDLQKNYIKHKGSKNMKDIFVVIEDALDSTINLNKNVEAGKEKLQPKKTKAEPQPLDFYAGYTADFLKTDLDHLTNINNEAADATKNVHFGSDQYDKALKSIHKLIKETKLLGTKGKVTTSDSLAKLNNVYAEAQKKAQAYLSYKGDEKQYKPGSKPYKRIQVMKKFNEYCSNKLELMNKVAERMEIMDLKKKADKMMNDSLSKVDVKTVLIGLINACKNDPSNDTTKIKAFEQIRAMNVFKKDVDLAKDYGMNAEQINELKSIATAGKKAETAKKQQEAIEQVPVMK